MLKRRLKDNGVTGRSDTITLHVAKTQPGDKVVTSGKNRFWDEKSTSMCASDSVLVFIDKTHGGRATVAGLAHYRDRNHKVLLVTDETKVIRHVEHLGILEFRDWAGVTNVNYGSGDGKGNPEPKPAV